ncbi:MAG: topoisomerase-4 subunit A [Candidatus Azotimanducaceae bacterium]|jgi:topoisomerase-4 subunit A
MAEEEDEMNQAVPEGDDATANMSDRSNVIHVSGMYKDWFLDYASYVILERAVPGIDDGFKPVQRRLMHAMKDMDDGRYHKVANIIGQTMKFHPHGDASIGDALVQLAQKDLLVDMQGNWGNIHTGDRAAAPRYIEARLSKFALDVVFSPKVTEWKSSYDGRAKEPVNLPVKFPLLLTQGVEGIAVGLSTKIMPHNFLELIDGAVNILRGKSVKIFPDFPTGGDVDVSNYNDGLRGGKVRVRAKIRQEDKKTLIIHEIPFGTNTGSLIESILKANEKGKIKIKKIEDNTAEHVEIVVHLPPNISPDQTISALFAFTDCEISISPLSCVIVNDKPLFQGVSELLKISVNHTVYLLKAELEVQLAELQEQWHFASLERIFIKERIYRDIEECESWEEVITAIRNGLKPFIGKLLRAVTDDDITRLTEIRIKRITKFDSTKADDYILRLEGDITKVKHHLENLIEFAIAYFKRLKKTYGAGKERKAEIKVFDTINARHVAIANTKLYVNRAEGFIGSSLRKDEFVCDCSDIDKIIVFREDGQMVVAKVENKTFVGKGIIHVAIFKKGDKRTIYNLVYKDGGSTKTFMKRFAVTSVTMDKEYDLTAGNKGSKVLYFTANPNGEAEVVTLRLKPIQRIKKLKWDIDFSELAIKGRTSKGNLVSKFPIKEVSLKEEGVSTLAARKIWFDDTIKRLNTEGRGELLGSFSGDDKIIEITQAGYYKLVGFDLMTIFEDDMIHIQKFNPETGVSAIYWDGEKERFYGKRFLPEQTDKLTCFIKESSDAHLEQISTHSNPSFELVFTKERNKEQRPSEVIDFSDFISVKGLKAQGNQLTSYKVKDIIKIEPEIEITAEGVEDSGTIDGDNQTETYEKDDDEQQITLEFD